jgi:hypothetical protein
MQSSTWRLREQKRKEEAESAARRRAVEKNEISFPSLGQTTWGQEVQKTESAAARKWSTGDVVRTSLSPTKTDTTRSSVASSAGVGIHAQISSRVNEYKRTTTACCWGVGDSDDAEESYDDAEGWTEVSRKKTASSLHRRNVYAAKTQDYDEEEGGYADDGGDTNA